MPNQEILRPSFQNVKGKGKREEEMKSDEESALSKE